MENYLKIMPVRLEQVSTLEAVRENLAERGIRTPGTGFSQYNGLANQVAFVIRSENFGLYYIPEAVTTQAT